MTENKTLLRLKDKVGADLYKLLTTGQVLFLTLNKKWYKKIASGEKKEEYRKIKPYWIKRFINWQDEPEQGIKELVKQFEFDRDKSDFIKAHAKKFDLIVFVNGYGDAPTMIVESRGLEINTGRADWGALPNQFCFVLKLGDVLYSEPCK